MQALIFTPVAPGDHEVTPEARIASLAMHVYASTIALGEKAHENPHLDWPAILRTHSDMLIRIVMELYPKNSPLDGFTEIWDFAARHGLAGELQPDGEAN